jgi:hypothetical protein
MSSNLLVDSKDEMEEHIMTVATGGYNTIQLTHIICHYA